MKYLILLVISINLFANKFYLMNEKEINSKIIKISKDKNLNSRIKKFSYYFLNTPYELSPLGEGIKKPIYSFKKLDCLTFIESLISLGFSKNIEEFKNNLQKIRYKKNNIKYEERNHFMISQWIPNNIIKKFIKDITKNIAIKNNLKLIKSLKKITIDNYKKSFKKFKSLKKDLPLGDFSYEYISLDDFIKNYNNIKLPSVSIMTVIRKNKKDLPIIITHLGIVFKYKNKYIFRNATTSTKYKLVKDFNLISYLKFYKKYYKNSWPLAGIKFYRIENQ